VTVDLSDLIDLTDDDPEMIPEILPVDARLSIRGLVSKITPIFERAATVTPSKDNGIAGTSHALLEAFASTGSESAYVRITATDGDITVSVSLDGVAVLMAGAVLVPGKKILDILKKAPHEQVQVTVLGNSLTIRSGRAQWTLATVPGDSLPPIADVSEIDLHSVPRRGFLSALAVARRAVGPPGGRMALMQAEIRNGAITACDGSRVHRQLIEGMPEDVLMAIPTKIIDELIRALRYSTAEDLLVGHDDYHLIFQIESDTLIGNRLMVPFPDIESLLNGPAFSNENVLQVDVAELDAIVSRVRINSDPDYASIILALVPGKKDDAGELQWGLVVKSRDRSGNTAQEAMECQWTGSTKARELCVNHKHFTQFLKSFGGEVAFFKIGNDTKTKREPIYLDDDEVGFTGIIQQMRPL
jgi:DNA polymerase III sliding clamp (beta) subunit (PCNA family)